MIDVSVVIPVFNAEKYIRDCIESLLAQTLVSCEFVFINDGSTDATQRIIESFRQKEERIVLFNQQNSGVSGARNQGIALAKGQYIGFVDADDTVAIDMYETLFNTAKARDCDIVVSNFIAEQDGSIVYAKPPFETDKVFSRPEIQNEILPFFIKNDSLNSCCTKIYKRGLLHGKGIAFSKGLELGEDMMFNLSAFSESSSVIFIDYNGYFYKEVAGSATRDIFKKDYFGSTIAAFNINYDDYLPHIGKEKLEELKAIRLINSVMSLIHIYLKPNKTVPFSQRYAYVKQMILNPAVHESVHKFREILKAGKSRYEGYILNCIRKKSALSLLPAVFYSNLRNKK